MTSTNFHRAKLAEESRLMHNKTPVRTIIEDCLSRKSSCRTIHNASFYSDESSTFDDKASISRVKSQDGLRGIEFHLNTTLASLHQNYAAGTMSSISRRSLNNESALQSQRFFQSP